MTVRGFSKFHSRFVLLGCVVTGLIIGLNSGKADEKPTPQDRLQQLLKRFPDADLNGDGTLTSAEARTYRAQMNRAKNEPTTNTGSAKPEFANVAYGPDPRHRLDLWPAPTKNPSPLIVYIHGGGFVAGSKDRVDRGLINAAHERGISFASINYRFVTQDMFPAPQHDGARAIQFLRLNAEKFGIDAERIGAFGGSAGAGISMWLAYHDDLADPNADDPLKRMSSRICVVGSLGGQTSYDPFVIRDWIGGQAHAHPSIYFCYRVTSLDQLKKPELQPLYDEVSAIKHVTPDDPATFMFYSEADKPLPANTRPGEGIHHPIFAHRLVEVLDENKIRSEYRHVSKDGRDWGKPLLDFFETEFEAKSKSSAKDS